MKDSVVHRVHPRLAGLATTLILRPDISETGLALQCEQLSYSKRYEYFPYIHHR